MRKALVLILLIVVVMTTVELFIIARWRTGAFDPRCLLSRGYVIAHTYIKGQETIRCVRETP